MSPPKTKSKPIKASLKALRSQMNGVSTPTKRSNAPLRSFNEGANTRFRPRVVRNSVAKKKKQASPASPKPKYHYPGERKMVEHHDTERPPVPPSRRKMQEFHAARSAKGNRGALEARAVLKVEQILASAARGSLNTGQWTNETTAIVSEKPHHVSNR